MWEDRFCAARHIAGGGNLKKQAEAWQELGAEVAVRR